MNILLTIQNLHPGDAGLSAGSLSGPGITLKFGAIPGRDRDPAVITGDLYFRKHIGPEAPQVHQSKPDACKAVLNRMNIPSQPVYCSSITTGIFAWFGRKSHEDPFSIFYLQKQLNGYAN
jgi:hypothetical protein